MAEKITLDNTLERLKTTQAKANLQQLISQNSSEPALAV